MCKPRVPRATSGDEHSSDTVNVGLMNMSKNSGDGLDATDIVIYVICAIVVFIVFKWIKKCVNRKLSQPQALPPAPQQPLPPCHLPHLFNPKPSSFSPSQCQPYHSPNNLILQPIELYIDLEAFVKKLQ